MRVNNGCSKGFRLGCYCFVPGLVSGVLVVLLAALMVRLGFWQLQRAEEKRELMEQLEQRRHLPAEHLSTPAADGDALLHRRVVLEGHYDAGHQVLHDNRVHKGIPGYHVYTPLVFRHGGGAVLVNRGWVPLGKRREDLPALPVETGIVRLAGMAVAPQQALIDLEPGQAYAVGWPKVAQHIRPDEIGPLMGHVLQPYVVVLDEKQEGVLARDWQPVNMHPGKHTSYAVQWFGLSALLLGLYLFIKTKRVTSERESDEK